MAVNTRIKYTGDKNYLKETDLIKSNWIICKMEKEREIP